MKRSAAAGARAAVFAVLSIEAARCLGFEARIVTGYPLQSDADNGDPAAIGTGTTHAWADIYLPGTGWTSYDQLGNRNGQISN